MAKKTKATVQFEADTSGFSDSIKKADTSLVGLRKELKLNASELKNDADNVNLLSDRKKILQNEADASKDKVDALTQKLETATRLFGQTSEEVRLLNNKLVDAKTEYQNIQNELNQTSARITEFSDANYKAQKQLGQLNKATEDLREGFTVFKGVVSNEVTAVIDDLKDALSKLVFEADNAYSQFAASTGIATSELDAYEDVINEIYESGLGESLNDIARSMAEVKQQTNETDPTKLKELTTNALMLQDVFGYDIKESMRAVNMLTEQFGISSKEAFNLIVQGAQQGLDKNGDLLDSINEYSVHYAQSGASAEQFFNSLKNGVDAGTFSVDKLGDAYKEFNIKVKSGDADDYLKKLGFNVDSIKKALAEGGENGQEAMTKITNSVMSIEDPIKRNEYATAMWGTMWEDLGEEGIRATMNLTGEIDKSKSAMEDMANVKYDNLSSDWETLGRQIKTDFIDPISRDLMPILKDGIGWLKTNLPTIAPIIAAIGAVFATYFAVSTISGIVGTFTTLFSVIKEGTGVMSAFNMVMGLNPVALIVAAIVGLIAVFALLWTKCEGFREFWINIWNMIKGAFDVVINGISIGINFIISIFQTWWNFIISFYSGIISIFLNIPEFFMNLFSGAVENIQIAFSNVKDFFLSIVKSIKNVFSGIANFFKDIFSKAWNNVKNIFSTGGKIFSGIVTGISDTFKKVVNAIIDGLNKVISVPFKTVNKVLNKVRNVKIPVIDVKPFSGLWSQDPLPVPQIPRLKVGLDYVPKDFFPAFLDEGERVLTKEENSLFNSLGGFAGILTSLAINKSGIRNDNIYAAKLDELISLEKSLLNKPWSFNIGDKEIARATRNSDDVESANLINLRRRGLAI